MVDFIGIGTQKAGTTWLTSNLAYRPDVWLPPIKELHYFDSIYIDDIFRMREIVEKQFTKKLIVLANKTKNNKRKSTYLSLCDKSVMFTDQWYHDVYSLAKNKNAVTGEFTPNYCAIGQVGAEHMKRINSLVKLIYIIRDPIDRYNSSLRMLKTHNSAKKQRDIVCSQAFHARGDYKSNIPIWDSVFPSRQILYLPFGRIRTEPLNVMRDIEHYLGLAPYHDYPRLQDKINAAKKIEISEFATTYIQDIAEPQYAFLESRFGSEFIKQIK